MTNPNYRAWLAEPLAAALPEGHWQPLKPWTRRVHWVVADRRLEIFLGKSARRPTRRRRAELRAVARLAVVQESAHLLAQGGCCELRGAGWDAEICRRPGLPALDRRALEQLAVEQEPLVLPPRMSTPRGHAAAAPAGAADPPAGPAHTKTYLRLPDGSAEDLVAGLVEHLGFQAAYRFVVDATDVLRKRIAEPVS